MFKLMFHEISLRRWAIIGWGLGVTIFGAYIIILYPQFAEPLASFDLADIDIYKVLGFANEFSSFKGFVGAEIYVFIPVLLSIYAIVNGTATLAGEEDNGTLEPFMALPLPRWQLVASKALALAVAFLIILLIVSLGLVIAFNMLPADVNVGDVQAVDLVLATLGAWPLLVTFSMLSLFLGAIMPNRRAAAITATVVLIASYFANNLAGMIEPLKDIQFLMAFHYYDGQMIMSDGLVTEDILVLLGASTVLLILALITFERRNVTVGSWPWQRARIPEQKAAAVDSPSAG